MPKMHQNTFGGRAQTGQLGELKRSPDPIAAINGVLLLREGKGRREGGEGKGEGRGAEGKGKEEARGKGGEGRDVAP